MGRELTKMKRGIHIHLNKVRIELTVNEDIASHKLKASRLLIEFPLCRAKHIREDLLDLLLEQTDLLITHPIVLLNVLLWCIQVHTMSTPTHRTGGSYVKHLHTPNGVFFLRSKVRVLLLNRCVGEVCVPVILIIRIICQATA